MGGIRSLCSFSRAFLSPFYRSFLSLVHSVVHSQVHSLGNSLEHFILQGIPQSILKGGSAIKNEDCRHPFSRPIWIVAPTNGRTCHRLYFIPLFFIYTIYPASRDLGTAEQAGLRPSPQRKLAVSWPVQPLALSHHTSTGCSLACRCRLGSALRADQVIFFLLKTGGILHHLTILHQGV